MKKTRKLSRQRDQRRALLKGLAANLILKEKIKTTEAKAKEMRSLVEKLVTKAKKGDLTSVRYAAKFLPPAAREKLIKEIGPRYQERSGGYLRIIKVDQRKSDSAKMVVIQFV